MNARAAEDMRQADAESASLQERIDALAEALRFVIRFHDQLTPADAERMRAVLVRTTGSAA